MDRREFLAGSTAFATALASGPAEAKLKAVNPTSLLSPLQRFQITSAATAYTRADGGTYIVLSPKAETLLRRQRKESLHAFDKRQQRAINMWRSEAVQAGIHVNSIQIGKGEQDRAILYIPSGEKPEIAYAQTFNPTLEAHVDIHDRADRSGSGTLELSQGSHILSICNKQDAFYTADRKITEEVQAQLDKASLNISRNFPENLTRVENVFEGSDGNRYIETRVRNSNFLGDERSLLHRLTPALSQTGVSAITFKDFEQNNTDFGAFIEPRPYVTKPGSALVTSDPNYHLGNITLKKISPDDAFWRVNENNGGLKDASGKPLILESPKVLSDNNPKTTLRTLCTNKAGAPGLQ